MEIEDRWKDVNEDEAAAYLFQDENVSSTLEEFFQESVLEFNRLIDLKQLHTLLTESKMNRLILVSYIRVFVLLSITEKNDSGMIDRFNMADCFLLIFDYQNEEMWEDFLESCYIDFFAEIMTEKIILTLENRDYMGFEEFLFSLLKKDKQDKIITAKNLEIVKRNKNKDKRRP